jgi:hypothetical protein
MLQKLRQQARRELLVEARKHAITARLRQIPYLGPIRSAPLASAAWLARLTLARKIAAITLTLWKKGENFDAEKLKSQAA